MSGDVSVPATIWEFQIVRFWDAVKGNYLRIPDSSSIIKNTENGFCSARIANVAILDGNVDATKTIRDLKMITGGRCHALS